MNVLIYVCVIYRTRNVLEIEFYPSWNILEYTGISFLYCCTNPVPLCAGLTVLMIIL